MASSTSDGFVWERSSGVRSGLETDAVISPSRLLKSSSNIYDAIVVGAGYAGLAAARDLKKLGKCMWLSQSPPQLTGE